jgi:aerobic carbon-monoxide dehydrogenase medium subunit
MLPSSFEYHRPGSLEETLDLLGSLGEEAKVLAGGQSLIPILKLRLASPAHLVDVNRIPGLDGIEERDGALRIGALVRHNALVASDVIARGYPTIAAAAPQIADPIVRNLGTIGGSLSHADPAGDLGSVMLALGASVVLRSKGGEREVRVSDFLMDAFTSDVRPGELLTEVRVPTPPARSGGAYLKLERKVGDFATVGVAVALTLSNGSIGRAGLALTGVGLRNIEAPAPSPTSADPPSTSGTSSTCSFAAGSPARSSRRGPEEATMQITVTVNGVEHTADVEPRMLLVHLIREQFELTGTHIGCDTTSCGACTVLLDGQPVKSCTVFGVQADGRDVMTVEGMMSDGALHPIQAAFKEEHGLQCGFCTPAMMLVAKALLDRNPDPSDEDVRWAISGNICRCTGYMNIVKAIRAAAGASVPAQV